MLPKNISPWRAAGVSYKAKYYSKIGLRLLPLLLIPAVVALALILWILRDTPVNLWKDWLPDLLTSAIVTVWGMAVFIILVRIIRQPISFITSYNQIPPGQFGQTFEVWFEKPNFQRSFDGKGLLRFEETHLFLTGTMSRPFSGQIITDILVLFMPREEKSLRVPYENIDKMTVNGRCIRFKIPGGSIFGRRGVILFVSEVDGERMYRELSQRFPTAMQQYLI